MAPHNSRGSGQGNSGWQLVATLSHNLGFGNRGRKGDSAFYFTYVESSLEVRVATAWKLTSGVKGDTINLSCGKGGHTSCSLPHMFQLTCEVWETLGVCCFSFSISTVACPEKMRRLVVSSAITEKPDLAKHPS